MLVAEPDRSRAEGEPTVLAASAGGAVTLEPGQTRVPLIPAEGAVPLAAVPTGRRVVLLLRGLYAEMPPLIVYAVVLDLPPDANLTADDPGLLGRLSFFGVPAVPGGVPRNVSFEVTPTLPRLRQAGRLDRPTVTFVPAGAPAAGSNPSVGSVRLVAY